MEKKYLVLKLNNMGYRTRDLETGKIVSIQSEKDFTTVELDTITFQTEKAWEFKKNSFISGTILHSEFLPENLLVPPLAYSRIAANTYEFWDYTGYGFYTPGRDPILEAIEMERQKGYDALTRLWERYPQCIDALVYIGDMNFDSEELGRSAFNCYQGAIHIAEQEIPLDDKATFPWHSIYNRPYLRALHGLTCWYWKQDSFELAEKTALKLLRLNPRDNQGIRYILKDIQAKEKYSAD